MGQLAETETRYRAFLSYSHRDSDYVERFHRDLERWRADREIVGRVTSRGPVPRHIRPIFRDRDDFAGGSTLAQATAEALDKSENLIVICTPNAAQSPYVNEEIRRFKQMGRGDRIIPVIADGEPGDPDQECFPTALTRAVDADGQLTEDREEPLAADARDQGDGPRRALAKVIAGILDLPFDEIIRRAEKAQRRRTRMIAATATVMGVLAVAAAAFGWLAENRRVEAERNYVAARDAADQLLVDVGVGLISIEGVPLNRSSAIIERATEIYDGLIVSLPQAPELRFRKAGALASFGQAYMGKGNMAEAQDELQEAERVFAELERDADPAQRLLIAPLLATVRNNIGTILIQAGETTKARAILRQAIDGFTGGDPDALPAAETALLAVGAFMRLGLLEQDAGEAVAAETWFNRTETIIAHFSAAEPDNARWPATRGILLQERATRAQATGDAAVALTFNLTAGEKFDEVLITMPDFVMVQAAMIQNLRQRADLLEETGNEQGAAAARDRLARIAEGIDQSGVTNQMTIAASTENVIANAMTQMEAGQVAAALPALMPALAQLEAAQAADPANALLAQATDWALAGTTRAIAATGPHRAAWETADRLIKLRTAAEARIAENADARAATAEALGLRADAEEQLGDRQAALATRLRQLEIEADLAKIDPSRRRILADVHDMVALVYWRLSQRPKALPHFVRRAEILGELLPDTPDDPGLVADLAWSFMNIGELRAIAGDREGALQALAAFNQLASVNHLAASNERWLTVEYAWSEARLAQAGNDAACRWPKIRDLMARADQTEPLSDPDEELYIAASVASLTGPACER